jgi:hypothetical protein
MGIRYCLILLLTAIVSISYAQDLEIPKNEDGRDQHNHDNRGHFPGQHIHHKNEIGIANAPVYFVREKELSYGLHIHYVRNIKSSRFGIGLAMKEYSTNMDIIRLE